MKNILNFTVLITTILIVFLSTDSQAKVYLCGQTGEIVRSEDPCKIPKTDHSLKPVKSDSIDRTIIDSTVDMIRKAFLNRDILAIERLLTDDFIFTSNEGDWDGKELFNTDKSGFIDVMTEHLLAMTDYEQDIDNYSVRLVNGYLIAETTSRERVWLGKDIIRAKLLERIRVISVNGYAKIQSIKQVELK